MRVWLFLCVAPLAAPGGVLETATAARGLLEEMTGRGDIPREVLQRSQCVAMFPGATGEGVATCRTGVRSWSGPVALRMEGAAVPAGTVFTLTARRDLTSGRIPADDASFAVYGRNGGKTPLATFAGATFRADRDANRVLYGAARDRDILFGRVPAPERVRPFITWMISQANRNPQQSRKPSALRGDNIRSRTR